MRSGIRRRPGVEELQTPLVERDSTPANRELPPLKRIRRPLIAGSDCWTAFGAPDSLADADERDSVAPHRMPRAQGSAWGRRIGPRPMGCRGSCRRPALASGSVIDSVSWKAGRSSARQTDHVGSVDDDARHANDLSSSAPCRKRTHRSA